MSKANEATDLMVERMRIARLHEINANSAEREQLEAKYGEVWNPAGLAADFEVKTFAAPYVIVTRKADGKMGTLEFQHHPRFYFNYQEDK